MNAVAADLLTAFEGEKNNRIETGAVAGGASIRFAKDRTKPDVIVLDPTTLTSKQDAVSGLLFELLRYKSRAAQVKLNDDLFAGNINTNIWSLEVQFLAYQMDRQHHTIAGGAVTAQVWAASTDSYAGLLQRYPNDDEYMLWAKDNAHYMTLVKNAQKALDDNNRQKK